MRRNASTRVEVRADQEGPAAAASRHAHHYVLDAANYGRCTRCPAERQFRPETTTNGWEYREERDPPPQIHRPARRRQQA